MGVLTITTKNSKELSTLKKILEALDISFTQAGVMDETAYLQSTKANRESLKRSLDQAKKGKFKKVGVKDLWK